MVIFSRLKNWNFGWRIRWQYLLILIIGMTIGIYATLSVQKHPAAAAKVVILNSRGVSYSILTSASEVGGVLAEQGLETEKSQVSPGKDSALTNGMLIDYRSPVIVTVVDGGKSYKISTTAQNVGEALADANIALGPKDQLRPEASAALGIDAKIQITRVEEFEEEKTESLAFQTKQENNPEALIGHEEVVQPGQSGEQLVKYFVRLKDGKEIYRSKISAKITRAAVARVVRVGTKIVVESYEQGIASWYAYKKCMCAAHPYFPKGSMLRVTNIASGVSVVVRVNDWGPQQDVHPGRVIDLDVEAFKKLAPLSAGTMQVKVEKLKTE